MVKVVLLVIAGIIYSNLSISDNLEPFSPSTSTSFFLFPAPVPVSIAIVLVVVSFLSFPVIVVAIASSIVLGTDEHLRPGLLSSDDVTEQICLEEFLPENVGQFGDDKEKAQHVGQPEVVVGYGGISCALQISLVNVASSHFTCSGNI